MTEPFLAAIVLFGGNIITEIPAHNHATTHNHTCSIYLRSYLGINNIIAKEGVLLTRND